MYKEATGWFEKAYELGYMTVWTSSVTCMKVCIHGA